MGFSRTGSSLGISEMKFVKRKYFKTALSRLFLVNTQIRIRIWFCELIPPTCAELGSVRAKSLDVVQIFRVLISFAIGSFVSLRSYCIMKKTFVLITLFVLPVVVYLFFASGVYNFGKLPLLTENVAEVSTIDDGVVLSEKITILGFLGENIEVKKGNAFNLNQKIYKRFYKFNDFQFVMLVPNGTEKKVEELKKELGNLVDIKKWNFVFADENQMRKVFESLKTDLTLDENLGTPYVFIIDKDKNLRGRDDDEGEGAKYGFNTASVADLNNKMEDDVKIILAEYRLALKKNNADRKK